MVYYAVGMTREEKTSKKLDPITERNRLGSELSLRGKAAEAGWETTPLCNLITRNSFDFTMFTSSQFSLLCLLPVYIIVHGV